MLGKSCQNALSLFFILTPVISYVHVVLGCQKKIPEPARSTKTLNLKGSLLNLKSNLKKIAFISRKHFFGRV